MNYNVWLSKYMKALFVLSATYNPEYIIPSGSPDKNYTKIAMKCFIESLTRLLPDKHMTKIFEDFMTMNIYVRNYLFSNPETNRFFDAYPDLKNQLLAKPSHFFDFCLQSSFTLFVWVYLLNSYIIILFNKSGHVITFPVFNQLRSTYDINKLDKEDWGNPLWFIIHISPLYAIGNCLEVYNNLKSMLSCLRFILPCQKCQAHLTDNLSKIDIDDCSDSREKLFESTWRLHNIVSQSIGKYQPTLEEARQYYKY